MSIIFSSVKCKSLELFKLIFPLCILISLYSCKGRHNSDHKEVDGNSLTIGKVVSKLDDKIWDIYQDRRGNYWFGSNGSGVFYFDGKDLIQFTIEDGLVDDWIRGIQEDKEGNIFIETPEGVSKFDGKTFNTLIPTSGLLNQWKIEPDDLWFNCNGNPNDVYRYDGEFLLELQLPRKELDKEFGFEVRGLSFRDMNHSPYSVFGINKDKNGNIWFGTITAGAFRFDGESFLWFGEKELSTLPDGRVPGVRSILQDKDGYFWLSNFISKYKVIDQDSALSYEKLLGIDMSKDQFGDRLPYFNSGLVDVKGDLWMTSYSGIVWKYDGEELLSFPVTNGDLEILLVSIYQDKEGTLWLGTDNDGVYKRVGGSFVKFEPLTKDK